MTRWWLLLLVVLVPQEGWAVSLLADSCSSTHVQAAIDSEANGDTVAVALLDMRVDQLDGAIQALGVIDVRIAFKQQLGPLG